LRPGQFVTAKLLADSAHGAPESLAVPRGAVQTVEGKSLVFRKKADGYEAVSVEVGASSADLIEIRTGLAENDEVVVDGAFLLKSEYSR
jgi:cobalt-zinc-cadmium efflux system membrane fusion protein